MYSFRTRRLVRAWSSQFPFVWCQQYVTDPIPTAMDIGCACDETTARANVYYINLVPTIYRRRKLSPSPACFGLNSTYLPRYASYINIMYSIMWCVENFIPKTKMTSFERCRTNSVDVQCSPQSWYHIDTQDSFDSSRQCSMTVNPQNADGDDDDDETRPRFVSNSC